MWNVGGIAKRRMWLQRGGEGQTGGRRGVDSGGVGVWGLRLREGVVTARC